MNLSYSYCFYLKNTMTAGNYRLTVLSIKTLFVRKRKTFPIMLTTYRTFYQSLTKIISYTLSKDIPHPKRWNLWFSTKQVICSLLGLMTDIKERSVPQAQRSLKMRFTRSMKNTPTVPSAKKQMNLTTAERKDHHTFVFEVHCITLKEN